ncbi:MAG: ATP phosphoribosyltransferase regulatory subunit [Lachnospiraceae bacterium]
MSKQLLHTPEGVRDIYGAEYAKKLKIQEILHHKIQSFGFSDIQTPTFEFFDVFSSEVGTVPSKELYKFFDKEGNTLVLRPDFTPSMARCAAKYFMEEDIPIRFSYVGNTFVNTSNLQGKLKEVTQMGAELIGDASIEADAEMISLVVEALRATGLREFQVSIGQVDFFKGLCEEVGLNEETEWQLRELIANKNYFGAEELLHASQVAQEKIAVILKVTDMFGAKEALREASALVHNERSINAIRRLERLYELLVLYQVDTHISFDLGMLSKYNYYTGVIFKAYTYGVGDAIVTGGRYDTLLHQFGKEAAAIGCMVVIDDLMEALASQQITVSMDDRHIILLYQSADYTTTLQLAQQLRAQGNLVELMPFQKNKTPEQYREFAKYNKTLQIMIPESPERVSILAVATGIVEQVTITALLEGDRQA